MNILQSDYRAALYIRLSKDDGDKEESESVQNQRKILNTYAKENKFKVYDEYVDDGYTGTNFNRPGFKRMIEDVEKGKINMIISKTLSRLGRDYIETGRYIESYFPEKNIRYIAILDDIDTFLDKNCDTIAFKNIMNDYYAKETSKNIKKTKHRKREEGVYYTTFAPFGYKKIDKVGNLEIVESQAVLIRRIFNMFLAGKGTYQIATLLNEEKVLPPGLQMDMNTVKNYMTNTTDKWRHGTIRRILENPFYIGDCVQNKTSTISYKSKKRFRNSQEDYVVFKNHHKPIIDIETWNKTQTILKNRKNTKIRDTDVLLKGLVYCSHCNAKYVFLTRVHKNKTVPNTVTKYMNCVYRGKTIENKRCDSKYRIYESFEKQVIEEIDNVIEFYSKNLKNEKICQEFKRTYNLVYDSLSKKEKLEKELENVTRKIRILYNDKLNGVIEHEDYMMFSQSLVEERKRLEDEIAEENKILDSNEVLDDETIKANINKIIKKYCKETVHTKEMLNLLVKKITIDKDSNVVIYFNFKELEYARRCMNVIQP